MFPNKLHWKYFRWVVFFPVVVSLWHCWGGSLVVLPCTSALVVLPCPAGAQQNFALGVFRSTEDARDLLNLQCGCGQHSQHPRIFWPTPKSIQEFSKALSYHLKISMCWQCNKNSQIFFIQMLGFDSVLDFFFPPLGRWHSTSFLSLFLFQWITFQMRRLILKRSWICWKSDLRHLSMRLHVSAACSFQFCPLPWGVYSHSFPRALALATFWDVFCLLSDIELESCIVQTLHGFKTVLSLSARNQNSELIHAFPNS